MYKKTIINILSDNGDSVVDFYNGKPIVCTTDFDNKYIQSVPKSKRFKLRGVVLVFSWTDNMFLTIQPNNVQRITPLSNVLRNANG